MSYLRDSKWYKTVHQWVYYHYGKADHCEWCDMPSKRYEWANISSEYWKDRDDWLQLCTSCHKRLDYKPRLERDKKVSDSLKGRVLKHMEQPVEQYTLDGKLVVVHESLKKASIACGLSISAVSGVVNGYYKTAGGFKWNKVK